MKYLITLILISFCVELNGQGAMSPQEMEKRMNPGKEVQDLYSKMRETGWGLGAEQREFSVDDAYKVRRKIHNAEHKDLKQNAKFVARHCLADAQRRGCNRIIVKIKTGRLFGSRTFSFYFDDLLEEVKKNLNQKTD